jgi:hypothetical protein
LRKTISVIAEDFYDMLAWKWVRLGATGIERWRRHRMLLALDARVRQSAATASLTFLHTPAAVERYRLATRCGLAIRQPGHEQEDVISGSALTEKCAAIGQGVPLVIIAACRHKPLKGLDFLIDAVALLAARDIRVEARIYGDGDLTPQLRALVVRRGLTDHVSFPGALSPGASIYEAIASGHLCAMAHRTTDFGRAFWDAMVGGSPVIAFRTTASAGTVRDGVDGLLAPLDDVILFPEYYRWMVPGLPDPAFSQAAVLPIGIAFVVGEAAKWQVSVADLLVFGFAFCVGCSEYLKVGYNEAQNLMFDMLTWVIFPYVPGKGRIEPHNLTIPFAKRLVFLMFIISIVSVYEFKMGVTPWKLVLQRFSPWQGEGWVTTFRWGFARVAGPYGHAILAGVILITGYRIQRWLEWSQLWEPGFKNLAGLPVSKARMITIGLVFGVLMTMVRGPWIAGVLAAVLTGIGRAKNRWRAVGIIGAAMVVIGTPTVIAFKSYVSIGREGATSVAQESAAYRKELMEKYIDIALERSIWGWGRTTWPKIPSMPSIDNYYLLLALMHGVLALGFLLLIFLVMMTRLFIHSMRSPPAEPRGSCLGFTLCWASIRRSGSRMPRSTWEGRSSRSFPS